MATFTVTYKNEDKVMETTVFIQEFDTPEEAKSAFESEHPEFEVQSVDPFDPKNWGW